MDIKEILSKCDHTLLLQGSTWAEIKAICDDGIKFGCASVCIPASFVKRAKEYVSDRLAICTVIGFPNGYSTTAVKVFETADAIKNGADEIDMVINVGALKDKQYDEILAEINAIKAACDGKLEGGMIRGLIAAIFCGVLMYAAVKTYALRGTLVGIIFCIPTFILCGFEHSVADMYYFAVASFGGFDPMSILFVLVIVVGNTLGGWLLPVLMRLGKGKETENESK